MLANECGAAESLSAWLKTTFSSRKGVTMKFYSHFFSTVFDQTEGIGTLGRGTHYSILRAVLLEPAAKFHDFAVIWDEDHDLRIVWILEQIYAQRLLMPILAIGERKGGITVLTNGQEQSDYARSLAEIVGRIPSDAFSLEIERFSVASSMIINASDERVRGYLAGIDALWSLGSKACEFSVQPYGSVGSTTSREASPMFGLER
jgi:hypothetical protein